MPCSAHCLDLALEDICKLPWATSIISKANTIIKFLKNHHAPLARYRAVALELKVQKELLKPGETRFATSIIMLERLLAVRDVLETLMVDRDFKKIKWAARAKYRATAAEISMVILTSNTGCWWDRVQQLCDLCLPVVALLRMADSNLPCVGKIYNGCYQLLKKLRWLTGSRLKAVEDIITKRWDMMTNPLILAAYALDPEYLDCNMSDNSEVMEGFLTMLDRLCGTQEKALTAQRQFMAFRNHAGLFGREGATAAAKVMSGADWWGIYGHANPELANVAIKILSQVASACACERNWSTYDFIHSKRRNKLTSSRAEDLVFVFSNMNLVLRTQAIEYKEKHVQWAASSSEDVSASSGSEGEMDGGGHRGGDRGGGEAEAGAGGGAGAAGRVRVIPRAWGMSQMRAGDLG